MRKNKGKKLRHENTVTSRKEDNNARSSKTFITNGLWRGVDSIRPNTYVRNYLSSGIATVAGEGVIAVIDFKERTIFYSSNESASHLPLSLISPPHLGEFALELILSKDESENIIGDLAEDYVKKMLKYGITKAKVWYWKQVISSAWPLMCKVVRWGLFASAAEWIRRRV